MFLEFKVVLNPIVLAFSIILLILKSAVLTSNASIFPDIFAWYSLFALTHEPVLNLSTLSLYALTYKNTSGTEPSEL